MLKFWLMKSSDQEAEAGVPNKAQPSNQILTVTFSESPLAFVAVKILAELPVSKS